MAIVRLVPIILASYHARALVLPKHLHWSSRGLSHITDRPRQQHRTIHSLSPLKSTRSTNTDTNDFIDDEVQSMRAGAIKQELESYGISTKSFLEKSELIRALVEARRDGKTPIIEPTSSTATPNIPFTENTVTSDFNSASSSVSSNVFDRQQRIQEEIVRCKELKVSDLKQELESYGISSNTFFEKSEFVRAVAEARVDGIKKQTKKKKKRSDSNENEEVEEVKAKVEVITSDSVGPKKKASRDTSAGASANPYAGAGVGGSDFGPFGSMGGMNMGGIADMLKNMGGGMGTNIPGASPFGGAGMADAMKKAQEAMNNPKTRAVIEKAQKNPKVMAAVQECMGNPMAMTKYMNDPDVGPIIRELQESMI